MKFLNLIIYYDPQTDFNEVQAVGNALESKAPLHISDIQELSLIPSAYNSTRDQYNGQMLLNACIDRYKFRHFLWIVSCDLYVPLMNFVFGLASKYYGAVVSFYRLPSIEMKIKEALHETGHVLGLSHCKNYCVMQFSNSLGEALRKPAEFCKECQIKLEKSIQDYFVD